MVDDRTGSTWSHLDGSALSGQLAGEQLDIRPLQTTTWGAWLEEHPETTTVSIETGYSYRNVVSLGREGLRGGFIATLDGVDCIEDYPPSKVLVPIVTSDDDRTKGANQLALFI